MVTHTKTDPDYSAWKEKARVTAKELSQFEPEAVPGCDCDDWKRGMVQIVGAQQLVHIHGGEYTGRRFRYCPWCGSKLSDPVAEALPQSEADGFQPGALGVTRDTVF